MGNTNSCSRLFLKAKLDQRLFMITERELPWTATLIYKRRVPQVSGGSGIGINVGHMQFVDTQSIAFTKERYVRFSSHEQAVARVQDIMMQKYCYKCGGDPKVHCKKFGVPLPDTSSIPPIENMLPNNKTEKEKERPKEKYTVEIDGKNVHFPKAL
jgi:hypothetical protein